MNQPASKEPSMDEILSSIRQIIADDDAAGASSGAKPEAAGGQPAIAAPPPAAAPAAAARPAPAAKPATPAPKPAPAEKPLALSESQIVTAKPEPIEEAKMDDEIAEAEDVHAAPVERHMVVPNDVGFDDNASAGKPAAREPRAASPLPDPSLTSDLAEQLLAPTADAATRHAFTQLNALAMAGKQRTIEDLIREMLRPMLKGWLDENLPGMVERMVQREVDRISHGGH